MMKSLLPIPSALLGPAAPGASRLNAAMVPGGTHWSVSWPNSTGEPVQSTALIADGDWSSPAPDPCDRPADGLAYEGVLPNREPLRCEHRGGVVALRTGRRVPGVRPTFPGAGLIISRMVAGGWEDLAFADDPPDAEILAAALCVRGDDLLAAYLVVESGGGAVCRALRFSLAAVRPGGDVWRQFPAYPLSPGIAAAIAGMHEGVLIAGGGANFPDRPPWEGGVKRTYDEILALPPGDTKWRSAGKLPAPRAYATVVTVPDGVLAIGGENAAGFFQDALWLRWDGAQVVFEPAPALPEPLASPVAAVLDGKVYLAGGYTPAGAGRVSTGGFYCLDLADGAAGWKALPSWPGPTRALAVLAALGGAIYLISGLEMKIGTDGQPQITYLTDAYRYRPGGAWEKLPDLPWSVIAAPSPAPVTPAPDRIFVFGGVDGRQVGKMPRDRRVPEDILYFDVARHEWLLWPEAWPEPVVSAPVVPAGDEWIFVSGETMAGHRTTMISGWRPDRSQPSRQTGCNRRGPENRPEARDGNR